MNMLSVYEWLDAPESFRGTSRALKQLQSIKQDTSKHVREYIPSSLMTKTTCYYLKNSKKASSSVSFLRPKMKKNESILPLSPRIVAIRQLKTLRQYKLVKQV